MNVLWAHDHTFYFTDSGKFYSSGKLPYAVWERYLSVFDSLTVVSRGKRMTSAHEMEKKSLSSGAGVNFIVLPSLSNPVNKITKKGYVERVLTEAVMKADAVIARLPSEIGSEAIAIAKKLGKPFAVEVVACAWDGLWNYGSVQGKLYAPIATWKTKSDVKEAPYAIYVTEQFLQKRYPCPSGRTQSCSNVELPEMGEDVLQRRLERIRSMKTPVTIGLIGSLNGKTKGIDTALNALARIKGQLPPFKFRILGDGDKSRWIAMAGSLGLQENVQFDGVLPSGSAVFGWLDSVDIYIQPSFQEGLPRATIEAMGRGCPVIGSTAGGIPELLDPGCLFKPGQDKQLAALLTGTVINRDWMLEQSSRNFAKAANFTKTKLDRDRSEFWQSFHQYVSRGV
ncbi:glycosyltransferase family 4 protein [Paenibacillus chitinolyticus]|uniref:glycosyltransferase n=1 Tax=Paenibacillus chitinolyticus TaxID=79263 RepID=UPI002DB8D3BB|nr:glycosyltransferase family 4 protein [Paenibacillus chitinolyticus]MEC0248032.1 glycosyltransferase family 4 protein [Paenibacillus chitinolyticus]